MTLSRVGIPRGAIVPGSTADLIIDLLETDGGWFTAHTLEMEIGAKPATVRKSLYRLLQHGRVENRRVELALSGNRGPGGQGFVGGTHDIRWEWRATGMPAHWHPTSRVTEGS